MGDERQWRRHYLSISILACGATFRGPADAWAAANYIGVTGAVSVVAHQWCELLCDRRQAGDRQRSNAVQSAVAGQEHGRLPEVLSNYDVTYSVGGVTANGVGIYWESPFAVVTMRAAPTVTCATWPVELAILQEVQQASILLDLANTATGAAVSYVGNTNWVASAEL